MAGKRAIEPGPTHARVAANVRRRREERGLTLDALGARMGALGRPMGESALSKIESGYRRVNVDDLVTLALALEVQPNDLLFAEVPPNQSGLDAALAQWREWIGGAS